MTETGSVILAASNVRFGFPARPEFLGPIRLSLARGRLWGIIGPNGAGKTTLLRLLAGMLKPTSGEIRLDDTAYHQLSDRSRAKRIAYLPQQLPREVELTAGQVALMGRFPHRRFGVFENADDTRVTRAAMEETETLDYFDRPLATLSGGEAQRVHVAAALAQHPDVLLLDEPTAALDPAHQLRILGIVSGQVERRGVAAVVVTHDLNLAARFCTDVLLLDNGRAVAAGPPDRVLRPEVLRPVYGVEVQRLSLPEGAGFCLAPTALVTEAQR